MQKTRVYHFLKFDPISWPSYCGGRVLVEVYLKQLKLSLSESAQVCLLWHIHGQVVAFACLAVMYALLSYVTSAWPILLLLCLLWPLWLWQALLGPVICDAALFCLQSWAVASVSWALSSALVSQGSCVMCSDDCLQAVTYVMLSRGGLLSEAWGLSRVARFIKLWLMLCRAVAWAYWPVAHAWSSCDMYLSFWMLRRASCDMCVIELFCVHCGAATYVFLWCNVGYAAAYVLLRCALLCV